MSGKCSCARLKLNSEELRQTQTQTYHFTAQGIDFHEKLVSPFRSPALMSLDGACHGLHFACMPLLHLFHRVVTVSPYVCRDNLFPLALLSSRGASMRVRCSKRMAQGLHLPGLQHRMCMSQALSFSQVIKDILRRASSTMFPLLAHTTWR